ncbi:High affinity cGMP-specific 3',5'-cyclic phosphodiesterase 9A, partial [Geodia barretti]
MYGMIHLCHLQDNLTPLDLSVLMTSAICHDLDHPGYSNSYQTSTRVQSWQCSTTTSHLWRIITVPSPFKSLT